MKRRRSFTRTRKWIPAFAGMTIKTAFVRSRTGPYACPGFANRPYNLLQQPWKVRTETMKALRHRMEAFFVDSSASLTYMCCR